MLSQIEADSLINMEKRLANPSEVISFPQPGSDLSVQIVSTDEKERFLLDLERGRLSNRWKIQLRFQNIQILVRVDIGGGGHRNPSNAPFGWLHPYEDKRIECPHLQRYVEGYGDGWALPLPSPKFTNPDDVATTWVEFLKYCNIVGTPMLQGRF